MLIFDAVAFSQRGKMASVSAVFSLLSWRLIALCSLAPLCGGFLTVQHGFLANAVEVA